MIILALRTDKPEAELCLYEDTQQLARYTWQAHRQLAETISIKLKDLLESQKYSLEQLGGIIVFKGPGSFTGLRIGFSVANALASSLGLPIVSQGGEDWVIEAQTMLAVGNNEQIAQPEYGSPPHITKPKH